METKESKAKRVKGYDFLREYKPKKVNGRYYYYSYWTIEITGDSIKELPDNLTIDGKLHIRDSQMNNLPKGLIVKGCLWLVNTKICRLPEDLKASSLTVNFNVPIDLPKTVDIQGGIYINKTELETGSEELKGRTIYINGERLYTGKGSVPYAPPYGTFIRMPKKSTKKKFPEILKEIIIDIQERYKAKDRVTQAHMDHISIYWNTYIDQFNNQKS
jgi:hypothetical protein